MKKIQILLFIIIAGVAGCEKARNIKPGIPEGFYTGTFQRIQKSGDEMVSNVEISFYNGLWSGNSDITKYPALCSGSYIAKDNKLILENECPWTADFDWSLILDGEYNYHYTADTLIIFRDYGMSAEYRDIYRLCLTTSGTKMSPLVGKWIETQKRTDTIVFEPFYDGIYPVFRLNRGLRNSGGYLLPDFFSGPYWYNLAGNNISIKWFLSSNSIFNRYYFRLLPEENKFEIENFFADPNLPFKADTIIFVKIE